MAKGGCFEGEIARDLSLWFTNNERDDIFGRSDGSGGRFTSRQKKGKDTANMAGDITFIDSIGEPLIKHWCLEAKTGYADKTKVKDADGDVIKEPIYERPKKGQKLNSNPDQRKIIGWKNKVVLKPWDAFDFIDSKQQKPTLQKMWEQVKRDSELSVRIPVLIFRRNGRSKCIAFSRNYFSKLVDVFGYPGPGHTVIQIGKWCCVMSFKDFCKWIPDIRPIL